MQFDSYRKKSGHGPVLADFGEWGPSRFSHRTSAVKDSVLSLRSPSPHSSNKDQSVIYV
jgi:hypothetical protein